MVEVGRIEKAGGFRWFAINPIRNKHSPFQLSETRVSLIVSDVTDVYLGPDPIRTFYGSARIMNY